MRTFPETRHKLLCIFRLEWAPWCLQDPPGGRTSWTHQIQVSSTNTRFATGKLGNSHKVFNPSNQAHLFHSKGISHSETEKQKTKGGLLSYIIYLIHYSQQNKTYSPIGSHAYCHDSPQKDFILFQHSFTYMNYFVPPTNQKRLKIMKAISGRGKWEKNSIR